MDDLLGLGSNPVVKLLKGLLKDQLNAIVCNANGWLVLREVTGGRYPEESRDDGVRDSESSESLPCIVGLLLIVGLGGVIAGSR